MRKERSAFFNGRIDRRGKKWKGLCWIKCYFIDGYKRGYYLYSDGWCFSVFYITVLMSGICVCDLMEVLSFSFLYSGSNQADFCGLNDISDVLAVDPDRGGIQRVDTSWSTEYRLMYRRWLEDGSSTPEPLSWTRWEKPLKQPQLLDAVPGLLTSSGHLQWFRYLHRLYDSHLQIQLRSFRATGIVQL